MIWILVLLVLFIFQMLTILVLGYRDPAKTVAWLIILFMIPIVGFAVYYFIAQDYVHKRKSKRIAQLNMKAIRHKLQQSLIQDTESERQYVQGNRRISRLLHHLPDAVICKYNRVTIFSDTRETFGAIQLAIAEARESIHFQFYTIRDDKIGREFQRLLIQKACEGVEVRVLFDGIGSNKLSTAFLNELRDAGVEVHCFLPPRLALLDKRLNYRNHRKIVVIDGLCGFFGGMNVGDEYLGGNPKLGFWRDTHVMVEGSAVYFLQNTFLTDWCFASGKALTDMHYYPEYIKAGNHAVQLITSGPDEHLDAILAVYFAAISSAQKRIWLTSPYFVPDASIHRALKIAALSGIDIKIIVPMAADSALVHLASLAYMEELMQAGVSFYQYVKGFIHAKVLVVDDSLAFVGTANLDLRSLFSNFELNAVLFDSETIGKLALDFRKDLLDSRLLVLEEFQKRSRLERVRENFSRLLAPLL